MRKLRTSKWWRLERWRSRESSQRSRCVRLNPNFSRVCNQWNLIMFAARPDCGGHWWNRVWVEGTHGGAGKDSRWPDQCCEPTQNVNEMHFCGLWLWNTSALYDNCSWKKYNCILLIDIRVFAIQTSNWKRKLTQFNRYINRTLFFI